MTFKRLATMGRTRAVCATTGIILTFLAGGVAHSATDTANMTVQLTVSASCSIQAANTLTFTTATAPLTANIDNNTTIDVICSNGQTYEIGLDGGVAADVANRTMVNGGEDVTYSLSTVAPGGANWDDIGGNTITGVGTGATQTHTVFGRVPPQVTPTAATYTDTVLVTIEYF